MENAKEVHIGISLSNEMENMKIKSRVQYGTQSSAREIPYCGYVEWKMECGKFGFNRYLVEMLQKKMIETRDMDAIKQRILEYQGGYSVNRLQRLNINHCPYELNIPHDDAPAFIILQPYQYRGYCFSKTPSINFYSNRLHPFWVEATLEKREEAILYICFPFEILKSKIGRQLDIAGTAEPNEEAYLILDKNNKYAFLETCVVFGTFSEKRQKEMLQLLDGFLSLQT
ncbi:MAG: R.Pab1 family restriction endonuclease [Helicobacter sp.]|nr:R.Pab1 family restriction endonuclease [Helicobacter sp.]MDE7318024.1 R.Pab1 family restriction endonuclease [Helicobacter sp.]